MDSIDQMATQGVLEGVRRYGVIDLSTDKRCFIREATEELLDAKNYLQWAYGKNQIPIEVFGYMDKSIKQMIDHLEKFCQGYNLKKEE